MPSGTLGPVALCCVEVVRRSGLGGSGEGRGLPYVHPQHMEGMKFASLGAEQSQGTEARGGSGREHGVS